MTKRKIFIAIIIILILIPITLFVLQNISKTNQVNNNASKTNGNEIIQLNGNTNKLGKSSQKTVIKINIAPEPTSSTSSAILTPLSLAVFPLFVAKEKDFFGQNGLQVQLESKLTEGSVLASLNKQTDYSVNNIEIMQAALQRNEKIKIIMTYGKNYGSALSVRSGLKINDIKKIAVISNLFSPNHYQALKLINDNNLSAEVVGEALGTLEEINLKLQRMQADAIVGPIVYLLKLQESGYTFLKILNEEIPMGLVVGDEKITKNPKEIEKVVSSIRSALQLIQKNPVETKELLFKFYKVEKNEANKKVADELYLDIKQVFTVGNIPSQEGIDTLIRFGKTGSLGKSFKTFQDVAGQTVNKEDASKLFDFRFVK